MAISKSVVKVRQKAQQLWRFHQLWHFCNNQFSYLGFCHWEDSAKIGADVTQHVIGSDSGNQTLEDPREIAAQMLTNQEQPPSFLLGTQEHPVQQLKASTKIITVARQWNGGSARDITERPQLLRWHRRCHQSSSDNTDGTGFSLDRKPCSFQATISLVKLTKKKFCNLSKMLVATLNKAAADYTADAKGKNCHR